MLEHGCMIFEFRLRYESAARHVLREDRLVWLRQRTCLAVFAFLLPIYLARAAAISSPAEKIVLGMSTALTGPAADLGLNMRLGVDAALAEVNRAGGINGRMLELIALDDGYEPARAAPNTRELIDKHRVVAIIGNVGTPTAVASVPIAVESGTPFYGAFTGAGMLRRSPPDRCVFNYRASYAEETAAMVDALVTKAGLKPDEIAFFTQRDTYGDAGFMGGMAALKRHRLTNEIAVAHVFYERNTVAVEKALATLLEHLPPPKAVIMVGAYAPCAAFIRLAQQNELNALFLNVSFVGPTSLARDLGARGDGVIVTQVVPHFASELPIVQEYQRALRNVDPKAAPSFGSLEGYIATRILCRALAGISGQPARASIVDALEGLNTFEIGLGEPLTLSKTEHQASHRVWPTVLRGGKFIPLKWEELAVRPGLSHD